MLAYLSYFADAPFVLADKRCASIIAARDAWANLAATWEHQWSRQEAVWQAWGACLRALGAVLWVPRRLWPSWNVLQAVLWQCVRMALSVYATTG